MTTDEFFEHRATRIGAGFLLLLLVLVPGAMMFGTKLAAVVVGTALLSVVWFIVVGVCLDIAIGDE